MPAEDSISVVKTGSTISTAGTSSAVAIPTDSSGAAPKYVRIAATQAAFVKAGFSGLAAASGDVLVQPADAVILKVAGMTHIAAIQVAAAGVVQISPLEDQ